MWRGYVVFCPAGGEKSVVVGLEHPRPLKSVVYISKFRDLLTHGGKGTKPGRPMMRPWLGGPRAIDSAWPTPSRTTHVTVGQLAWNSCGTKRCEVGERRERP